MRQLKPKCRPQRTVVTVPNRFWRVVGSIQTNAVAPLPEEPAPLVTKEFSSMKDIMPKEIVDTSNFEYKDMFGRDIKVGDYIVYAGLADRSAVMRAGRVIELTHSKEKVSRYDRKTDTHVHDYEPKVKCESWNNFRSQGWRGEDDRSGKQKAVSLGFLDRLIVVPEEYVSQKIKDDLAGPVDPRW